MDVLVGKKITGVEMTSDSQAVRFIVEGREAITYIAEGDCCSSTWIAHFEGVERLIGATVVSLEDIGMPQSAYDERTEEREEGSSSRLKEDAGFDIKYYGLEIRTDKGSAVIDYRNSSNGYYGGSLSCTEGTYASARDVKGKFKAVTSSF